MPEIGERLRQARMRARIDVSEIEAKTKIRAKYLRALENEEWSLLPGPTFVKSFLRTYAKALDLDGRALVEEYRLDQEAPNETMLEPIVSTPQRTRTRVPGAPRKPNGPSRAYVALVGVVVLVIVLLIVGLVSGGGGSSRSTGARTPSSASSAHSGARSGHRASPATATGAQPAIVALSLRPSARIYVCLIGDNGRKLIPGVELQSGVNTPTYHARHFAITLGNNSVRMLVDGRARTVPPSSRAIGYSITKAAGRRPLPAGQLPTCA